MGNSITLAADQNVTCTITNVDTPSDTLPGAVANLETIPTGSLIIPMDTALQINTTDGINDEPENFNLAAYGLANKMLQNNIPVKWAIRSNKVKIQGFTTGPNNSTSVIDATKNFITLGVHVGDMVTNVSNNPMGRARVTAVGVNTLTVTAIGGDTLDFDLGEEYVVDGHDFTATAERIRPGAVVPAASVTFAGGPFIISSEFPIHIARALEIMNGVDDGVPPLLPPFTANGSQQSVRVYRTTTPTNGVDVRYTLFHKPFAAISDFNTAIHSAALLEAQIPGANSCTPLPGQPGFNPNACNWVQLNPINLSSIECATVHLEPHRDGQSGATLPQVIAAVNNFVTGGGNLVAQCHAVEYFENNNVRIDPDEALVGNFLTTRGLSKSDGDDELQFPHPAVPFNQMTGPMDGGQGGSVPDWLIPLGGTYKNSGSILSQHIVPETHIHKLASGQVQTGGGVGGHIAYLGGHNYNGNGLEQQNGQRVLLNSLFIPPDRPQSCGLTINASLTIRKRIINDDGGTADVDDFNIMTSAGMLNFDMGVPDGGGTLYTADTLTVLAGIPYTLVEDNLPFYTEGTWSCTGGDGMGGGPFDSGSVTLQPGQSKTCTIENNDQPMNPDIEIVKSANPTTYNMVGDVITYTFTVTNTGDVTLDPVTVTDPLSGLSAINCDGDNVFGPLAPAAMQMCTATYTITQADIDGGSVSNTATAAGDCLMQSPCTSDTDDETVTAVQSPNVQIVKSAMPTTYDMAGDMITYTFTVTNTGNVTLDTVTVTDPLSGLSAINCDGDNVFGPLAPAAMQMCMATYTITQADVKAGSVMNTATASADCLMQTPCATDDDDETVSGEQTPNIQIVKSAMPTTYMNVGDVITYTFTVTNTGNITLDPVTVTDPLSGLSAINCDGDNVFGPLAPAAMQMCTATYTITQQDIDDGSVMNTATASGDCLQQSPCATDDDDETVTAAQGPDVMIVKTATPTTYSMVGDMITYTFDVTNTGNVTLYSLLVSDPLMGLSPITCPGGNPIPSLAPMAMVQCSATYTITMADITAGSVMNTATVTAQCEPPPDEGSEGQEGCATDDDDETITAVTLDLAKTVNGPATLEANGSYTVLYTITATNLGGGSAVYDLVDTFSPGSGITLNTATATYQAGTENDQSGTLGAYPNFVTDEALGAGLNESWLVEANFTVDPTMVSPNDRDCDPGDPVEDTGFYNAVSGSDSDPNPANNDTCTGLPDPDIDLAKTVNGDAVLQPNGSYTVVYTITASNNGDGPGIYDLVDSFAPGSGITLNTATAVYVAGTENSQSGTLGAYPNFVTGEHLAGQRNESWTVTANFTVDPTMVDPADSDCDPGDPVSDTGFYNEVSGVIGETDPGNNDTCTGLPDPVIDLSKMVTNFVDNGGSVTVTYRITADNLGNGPGFYDVVDIIAPAVGATVVSATLTSYNPGTENNQSGTILGDGTTPEPFTSGQTLVSGEALAGQRDESWTIVIEFDISGVTGEFECNGRATGTYNEVSGSETDPNPGNNADCEDLEQDRTTFLVTKDFSDDNPAGVTVFIECNTGLPLQQSGVVHDPDSNPGPGMFTEIEFVVGDFEPGTMDCDIEEAIPAGYEPTYTAGATTGVADDIFDDENGCHYELIQGGQFTCHIFNELQPVEVVVEKEWIDENPQFLLPTTVEVTLTCDGPIVNGYHCQNGEGGNGDFCKQKFIDPNNPGEFDVLPHFDGTTCSATEEPITGVLTDESDCEEMIVFPGQGDSCVIVNTRLFAGIPTLNQYGLMLLALLMLGIGALAYRRFA